MSFVFDMILHLFNSFITIVYYTGVMKVKRKCKWFNEAGLVMSLFVSAIVSHILRYNPPIRFAGVAAVMFITAIMCFDASMLDKVRTLAECIVLSMTGEMFGLVVCGIVAEWGFNILDYDSPDRAVMSLVLSTFIAGIVPVAILSRKKARARKLWGVALIQTAIAVTQISMIMLAYFSAQDPDWHMVYILAIIQVPGILLSLFCSRAILAITKAEMNAKEQEFRKTKTDMEYDYYKLALESNAKLSMLRHDISNTLQTAMTLIHNGKIQQGDELLREIDEENRSTAPVVLCDNGIINVILTLKHEEMKKYGISFKVNVKSELSAIPVSDRELTSVITNLIDNAVEACCKCEKSKDVIMTFGKQQGFYIIKVENSYCVNDIYVPDSVSEAITTKDDKETHGYGLRAIYEISKKYDGNFSMYREEDMVVSVVTFAEKANK